MIDRIVQFMNTFLSLYNFDASFWLWQLVEIVCFVLDEVNFTHIFYLIYSDKYNINMEKVNTLITENNDNY